MDIKLEAMAVAMPDVEGHPNRLPFRGVLTLVGVASQRSPSGARGHRVMLTRSATEKALPSLLGMAVDYTPSLAGHDARRKIGIITEVDIVPMPQSKTSVVGQIAVGGYLFAHDFPDVVQEIRAQPNSTLGMSYEIANITVPNQDAYIWAVTDFTFTGAAVLRRDKAAYPQTWISLATSSSQLGSAIPTT
ncbi:MAG TPA: hypothetical protein VGG15_07510 [Terriglobales bacterium]|jgi:hypothetical protein